MASSHWQLRSLISSPEPNAVLYPTGNDIYRLNTETRERELITTLPFAPRCLAATKDWVCCGAPDGQFAAINLVDLPEPRTKLHDVDASLPLSLGSLSVELTRQGNENRQRSTSRPQRKRGLFEPIRMNLGDDILNSVEIWTPQSMPDKSFASAVAIVT
jgi:hypothetical protein